MTTKRGRWVLVMIPVLLSSPLFLGCGKWPPVVKSAKDIQRLSRDEPSRARGLPDSDLYALERLSSLRLLNFGVGWKATEVKITDRGLRALSQLSLPRLEFLNLGRNENITDEGVVHLVRLKSLRRLSLTRCPKITDQGVAHLVKMSSLKSLRLSACQKITDRGLELLSGMDNLERLDLQGCNGITDRGILHLAEMNSLKNVMFGGCENITPEAVEDLKQRMPHARVSKNDQVWAKNR